MNMIRLIAIALPVMLLMACGGGGGGGTAASPTPSTNMPRTGGPTPMVMLETLPDYAVDAAMARTHTSGTAPTAANTVSETAIVTEIQRIATAADTFEFRGFTGTPSASITCDNANKSCSGTVPDVGMLTFSLADIDDLSLVDGTGLVGFDSDTEAVMVDTKSIMVGTFTTFTRDVTMIQSRAAARQNDGTRLTFQTYGGWIMNNVFGVEILGVTEDGTTTDRFGSFSFGNASTDNPSFGQGALIGTLLQWFGVMVGTNTQTGRVVQGDVEIRLVNTPDPNSIDEILFTDVKDLEDGTDITFGNSDQLQFMDIPITDGKFESGTGDIIGYFYESDHSGVGGTFNSSANNIIGAFGGEKSSE